MRANEDRGRGHESETRSGEDRRNGSKDKGAGNATLNICQARDAGTDWPAYRNGTERNNLGEPERNTNLERKDLQTGTEGNGTRHPSPLWCSCPWPKPLLCACLTLPCAPPPWSVCTGGLP